MRRGFRSPNYKITKLQDRSRGYMLITLMLALALMTIALLAAIPNIKQQITRDREEELRHRGTAYMRAIQHFYKKFGRYPSKIEELENTNNLRFLRKRYTDPINRDPVTGKEKDFKFLHQQDIALNNGPVLGAQIPGQSGPGGQGGFGGTQGGFGGNPGGPGGFGGQTGAGQQTGPGTQTSASGDSGNPSVGGSAPGNSSEAAGNSNSFGASSSNPNGASSSSSGFNGPTFGGGPILGVASASKAKTIRVFFDKNKYSDWLFIYLPMADRGGLLTGPVNPNMPNGNIGGLNPAQMPGGTQAPGGFGQGQSGFGQSGLGQGLSPNGGQNQGPQTPQTPAQPPQQ